MHSQPISDNTLMDADCDGDRFDLPPKERHGMTHGDNGTMLLHRVYK